jgi:hypothetical protein
MLYALSPKPNIKLQPQKSENETDVNTPGLIAGTPGINVKTQILFQTSSFSRKHL